MADTKTETKKDRELTPPVNPGPGATSDQIAEFNRLRLEYEQARADAQREAAETSPQVLNAP